MKMLSSLSKRLLGALLVVSMLSASVANADLEGDKKIKSLAERLTGQPKIELSKLDPELRQFLEYAASVPGIIGDLKGKEAWDKITTAYKGFQKRLNDKVKSEEDRLRSDAKTEKAAAKKLTVDTGFATQAKSMADSRIADADGCQVSDGGGQSWFKDLGEFLNSARTFGKALNDSAKEKDKLAKKAEDEEEAEADRKFLLGNSQKAAEEGEKKLVADIMKIAEENHDVKSMAAALAKNKELAKKTSSAEELATRVLLVKTKKKLKGLSKESSDLEEAKNELVTLIDGNSNKMFSSYIGRVNGGVKSCKEVVTKATKRRDALAAGIQAEQDEALATTGNFNNNQQVNGQRIAIINQAVADLSTVDINRCKKDGNQVTTVAMMAQQDVANKIKDIQASEGKSANDVITKITAAIEAGKNGIMQTTQTLDTTLNKTCSNASKLVDKYKGQDYEEVAAKGAGLGGSAGGVAAGAPRSRGNRNGANHI